MPEDTKVLPYKVVTKAKKLSQRMESTLVSFPFNHAQIVHLALLEGNVNMVRLQKARNAHSAWVHV